MATSKKAITFRVLAIGIATIVAIIIILLAVAQQTQGATSPLGRLGASVKEAIPFIPGVGDLIPKPCYSNAAVALSAGDNYEKCIWSPPERYGSTGGLEYAISGTYSCPAGHIVDFVDFTPNLAPTDIFNIYFGATSDDNIKQGTASLYTQFVKEDTINLYSKKAQSIKFAIKTGQPQVREFKQYAGAVVKNIYCSETLMPDLEPKVFEFTKFGKTFYAAPIVFENDVLTIKHGWRNNVWQTEDQACLDGQQIEKFTITITNPTIDQTTYWMLGGSTCTREAVDTQQTLDRTGKYVLESTTDPNSLLAESNENNNKRTATFTVIQSGGSQATGDRCIKSSDCLVNKIEEYCEWSKSSFKGEGKGECYKMIADYKNCGDEIENYLDDSCLGTSYCYVNIITPLAICVPDLSTGTDLQPSIAGSGSSPSGGGGGRGTVTWGVLNEGGKDAAAQSDAELWIDGVRVDTFKTAAPFSAKSYQEKGTYSYNDKYKATVKVDVNNAVQELIEQNNVWSMCLAEQVTYYKDADGDSHGDASQSLTDCVPKPAGYVDNSNDCNDNNANIYPGAQEVCVDSIDSNCNGFGDESYIATPGACVPRCTGTPSGQCSDFKDITTCIAKKCDWDNLFNFCKGSMPQCEDKSDQAKCQDIGCQWQNTCTDADGDGYGKRGTILSACTHTDIADCDDGSNQAYPGYTEVCDGRDNDCNSLVDDGLSFSDTDLYSIGPDGRYPTEDDVYYRDLAGPKKEAGVCQTLPTLPNYVTCTNNLWQWDYAKTAAQLDWIYETQEGNTNVANCNDNSDNDCDSLPDCGTFSCNPVTFANDGEFGNGICGQYCTNIATNICNWNGQDQGRPQDPYERNRQACKNDCQNALTSANKNIFKSSTYCYVYDYTGPNNDVLTKCWESPYSISCVGTLPSGETVGTYPQDCQ